MPSGDTANKPVAQLDPAMLDLLAKVLEKNPDLAKKFLQIPQVRQGLEALTAHTIGGYATLPALLALLSAIFTDKPLIPILLALAGFGITHFFPEVREFNIFNLLKALKEKQEGTTPETGAAAGSNTHVGTTPETGAAEGSTPGSSESTALTYPFAPQTPGTIGSVGEQITVPPSLLAGWPASNAGPSGTPESSPDTGVTRGKNTPASTAVNNLMKNVINSLLVNPVQRLQDVVYSAIRHLQPTSTQAAPNTSSPSGSNP